MGQSPSTSSYPSPASSRFSLPAMVANLSLEYPDGVLFFKDCTDDIPDECLAHIFQFLSAGDRKRCSLVCHRWLRVDGQSRFRLSLSAQSEIISSVPSLFNRFDSVSKLALRCDRKSVSLNDTALAMIAARCRNLTRLKLRGCRDVTDLGMAAFARECGSLKKLSLGSCAFGAEGLNAVLSYCSGIEELSIKRLRGIRDGETMVEIGAASLSLKSICLKELINGQCFEPLVVGAKRLKTLKVIKCVGDWDKVLQMIGGNEYLREVHLERIQVSDLGLEGVAKCKNIETLHLVKTPDCSNFGLYSVAENCKGLRKLHIDGWRTGRIGDEGLAAVAKWCPNLQELVLIGVYATQLSMSAIAANCQKLERLALCGSGTIGDAEIACVAAKCMELKKLCIKACAITDIAIEALAWGCPNLVKIKVRKCRGVSKEIVNWLIDQKASLVVNFDSTEVEGLDGIVSDDALETGVVEFPVTGGQVVDVMEGPLGTTTRRLALIRAKLGFFANRNLVACAFSRWSTAENTQNSNEGSS